MRCLLSPSQDNRQSPHLAPTASADQGQQFWHSVVATGERYGFGHRLDLLDGISRKKSEADDLPSYGGDRSSNFSYLPIKLAAGLQCFLGAEVDNLSINNSLSGGENSLYQAPQNVDYYRVCIIDESTRWITYGHFRL